MSLPSVYVATINTPGYLPQDDEPPAFDAAQEAWAYLASEREREEDGATYAPGTDTGEYSDDWLTLNYIANGEHVHGSPHEDTPTSADGSGTVYGGTPGYDGDHDLGQAYSVVRVDHSDYPHHAGYLVDCEACKAKCHCEPGSAECVYGGGHG